jgi:hypothetical protein
MFRNRTFLALGLGLLLGVAVTGGFRISANAAPVEDQEQAIAHSVYFTLKDASAEKKTQLVADCKKYLSKPEGAVAFAAGTRGEEFKGQANDKDFDVALILVFKDKAAFDKYAASDPHKKFIQDNLPNWKTVRVFDARVSH